MRVLVTAAAKTGRNCITPMEVRPSTDSGVLEHDVRQNLVSSQGETFGKSCAISVKGVIDQDGGVHSLPGMPTPQVFPYSS